MSRELLFYPAMKSKETHKYIPLLYDMDKSPAYVFWRSQSFIDMDYFTNELPMAKKEELDLAFDKICFKMDDEKDYPTYCYILTESELISQAKTKGIISGYIPIEEVKEYYSSEWPQEYLHWEMSKPFPAEIFLELPDEEKKNYMKFYGIDEYSKEYVCSVLLEILEDLWVLYDLKEEICYIVEYSF